MGGSGSRPRKLTLENENPMSVIKVSEDVVERIKGKEGVRQPLQQQQGGAGDAAHPPYLYQPSLTSIQIRQANLEALKENDAYWDKRIEQLQKRHQEMQHIMEEEYKKAVEEVKSKKVNKGARSAPCTDSRSQIIACYKKYKNEPMRCAKEVQQFSECVDQNRAAIIANKG